MCYGLVGNNWALLETSKKPLSLLQDPSNGGVPGPVELGEPLESMLSSLHSEEDGGTGSPPLQGPSLRRAREMCEAVATRAPLVFRPEGDAPVFKRVIHMLFSEDQQKRKAARYIKRQ